MIPIRDHNPSSTTPIVTYTLIGINIVVFFIMFTLSPQALENFIYSYSVIPADIVQGIGLITLITSMFLHGSMGHLLGNMIFLHIFGDNLEDRLGHFKYLIYYLVAGLAASFLQIAVNPSSDIPNLGASGAIAGLMGGYLVLFPSNPIDVLVPIGVMRQATVPAYTMLFYWIAAQFLEGVGSLGIPDAGGVAYFAHIGGFIAGVILIYLFRPRKETLLE